MKIVYFRSFLDFDTFFYPIAILILWEFYLFFFPHYINKNYSTTQ